MDEPPSLLRNVCIDEIVSYSVLQHSLSYLGKTCTIVSQTVNKQTYIVVMLSSTEYRIMSHIYVYLSYHIS